MMTQPVHAAHAKISLFTTCYPAYKGLFDARCTEILIREIRGYSKDCATAFGDLATCSREHCWYVFSNEEALWSVVVAVGLHYKVSAWFSTKKAGD